MSPNLFFAWVQRISPGRLAYLRPFLLAFLLLNAALRLGLAGVGLDHFSWGVLPALLIGVVFDLGVFAYMALPLVLLLLLWPRGWALALHRLLVVLAFLACLVWLFVAFSEVTFWNEFASRFNFIAVDYLIYTNEVLGNIRESYNLPLLLGGVAAGATLMGLLLVWGLSRQKAEAQSGKPLGWALGLWLALPLLAFVGLHAQYKEFSSDAQVNELAGNGYFDFVHAFNANEIDYPRFYKTLPVAEASTELAHELRVANFKQPYRREVQPGGSERRMNVVLVSIESFSAEFMGAFGNAQKLTPNMDALAQEGMLFTQLYATGTRTVRGLEALTLSMPPTPGVSILKRPNNENLFTIGEVFKEKGYEPLFIYGGYGYFDNMNAFYSGNGYTVIDRTALNKQDIHAENIWGVADEDLFTLALREMNQRAARKQPFFAHIMTTSNHRPYTYPNGRIDIPSKTGRDGAVKYTDWAIGQFVQKAKKTPWFANTLFVFVADHTHKGRGRTDLPPENYHIPAIFYAPGFVQPQKIDTLASQIDIPPTLLALLNFSYESRFFGQDILREGKTHQRALLANYQTVGYYEEGAVVALKPNRGYSVTDARTSQPIDPDSPHAQELVKEAISYYQTAAQAFTDGDLKLGHSAHGAAAVK